MDPKTPEKASGAAATAPKVAFSARDLEIMAAAFLSLDHEVATNIDWNKFSKFLGVENPHSAKTSFGMLRKKFKRLAEEGLPEGETLAFPKATPTPRKRRTEDGATAGSTSKPKRVSNKKPTQSTPKGKKEQPAEENDESEEKKGEKIQSEHAKSPIHFKEEV